MKGVTAPDKPVVGCRVEPEVKAAIEDLTPYLGGVETAKLSVVLREMIRISLAMLNPAAVARAKAVALHYGWDRETTWARLIEAGLASYERAVAVEKGEVSRGA